MSDASEEPDDVELVAVVAGCVLQRDDKYLLVQERQQRAYGLWNLPAGHVDKGESFEAAAAREAHEEAGFDVKIDHEIGIYHEAPDRAVKHAFAATITGGTLTYPKEELLDAQWFTFEQILALRDSQKLRAPWIWQAVTALREQGGKPQRA